MTSSGTYNFGLDNGSLVVESFERLGIMPVELTRQHFLSSRRSLNLEMQAWTNRGVNLWEVQSFTVELAVGQITYAAGAGLANIPQQIQTAEQEIQCIADHWGQPLLAMAAACTNDSVALAEDLIADAELLLEKTSDAGAAVLPLVYQGNPNIVAKVAAKRAKAVHQ